MVALLLITSLDFIITFAIQIRVTWRQFGQFLFCMFSKVFIFIASLAFGFSVFSVIGKIWFTLWRVWQLWVWLRVLWYILFSQFSLRFEDSVVSVSGLGSGVFVPTGAKSFFFEIVVFAPIRVKPKAPSKCFVAKILCSLSKFETKFYSYRYGLSSPYSFLPLLLHQNMIQHAPMVSLHRILDSGGGIIQATAFIQCVSGW